MPLNQNVPKCQKKLTKLLSGLNGVYCIKIEGDVGRKSTVRPNNTLASVLGEAMTERDYSCEDLPVACGYAHNQLLGYEMAGLHELAEKQKLKQLKFTQTRNLKMTFTVGKYDGPSSQKGSDKGGPVPEPTKADDPSEFRRSPPHSTGAGIDDFRDNSPSRFTSAVSQESIPNGSRSSHSDSGACPSRPHSALVAHSRTCLTPSTYHHHHMPQPYHGCSYPPPPYQGDPAMAAPQGKASCADLSCESASRCRMM